MKVLKITSRPERKGRYWTRRCVQSSWEEIEVFRQATGTDGTLFAVIDGQLYNTEHLAESGRQWFGPIIKPSGVDQLAVLNAVLAERCRQDTKHGPISRETHEIPSWIAIIRQKLHIAELHWVQRLDPNQCCKSLLAVAATAVAALEQHGLPEER